MPAAPLVHFDLPHPRPQEIHPMTSSLPPRSEARDNSAAAPDEVRQWLSALADGDRDAEPHCLARWREDPAARRDWHLYHLIGDVLRSEDLASSPRRDAQFLARLRGELAREPVPLAPAPLPQPAAAHAAAHAARRLGWRAPAAVAAGFVAVAATLVVMRPESMGFGGAQLASHSAPGAAAGRAGAGLVPVPASTPAPPTGGPLVADGPMLRDPVLNEYLRAHQAARGGAPAALPFGGMRNAEVMVVPAAPLGAAARQAASNAAPALRPASEAR